MLLIQFIVYSNIWISLGASLFTLFFFRVLHQTPNTNYLILVGLLTFIAYNFQRLIKMKKAEAANIIDEIPRLIWIKKHQVAIIITTLITTVFALYLIWKLDLLFNYALIISGLLAFFYVVRLPGIKHSLREIPGSKIFLISLSYSICCVLIPQELIGNFTLEMWVSFCACFFFILAITIPFDIRDVATDQSSIKTIPQLIGVKNAKNLALVLYSVACLSFIYFYGTGILITVTFGLIYGLGFINQSKPGSNLRHYGLMIDGLLIVIPLIFELELAFVN